MRPICRRMKMEMPKTKAPKTHMVCKTCGSNKVEADAFVVWDGWNWQVLTVFGKNAYCNSCDSEAELEEIST